MAFKKVCNDPLSKCANGSLEGYFLDPHKTESFDGCIFLQKKDGTEDDANMWL